jgi:hypothetical protein
MSAHYGRALKLFIQCGDREIDAAIEVVGKSQSEQLTHQLIDFLVGETDGVPKDPNYIYRLYMALKKYDDASKTALIIARQEQDMGNYALAHSVVFETIRKLEDAGIKVNLQLRQTFVLLHSYILAKYYLNMKDHLMAARLFLRVAQNVSKFPQHVVGILTTTVVECSRAELKSSGHEYALMLMRPEHRNNIQPESVKRAIEKSVRRKPNPEEEQPEESTPCPISGQLIAATQLECPTTRDSIPMCIITGKHMLLEDWCFCPASKCPALYSAYVQYIESYPSKDQDGSDSKDADDGGRRARREQKVALDPVLGQPVTVNDLKLCKPEDATKYIRVYNNVLEEKKPTEDEEGDEAPNANVNVQLGAVEWTGNGNGNGVGRSSGVGGNVNGMAVVQADRRNPGSTNAANKSPVKRSKGRSETSELTIRAAPGGEDRERDKDQGRKPNSPRRDKDASRDGTRDVRDRDGRDKERDRTRDRDDRERSKRPVK